MKTATKFFLLLALVSGALPQDDGPEGGDQMSLIGLAVEGYNPCDDGFVFMSREIGRRPSEENYWDGTFNLGDYSNLTEARISLTLDNPAVLKIDPEDARVYASETTFRVFPFGVPEKLNFVVKAGKGQPFPNVASITLNGQRVCKKPTKWKPTFLGVVDQAVGNFDKETPVNCGRKQVSHTELVTSGLPTRLGDWPWHTALYLQQKNTQTYRCGGSLVSPTTIVTAAHCVTVRGEVISSDLLIVILGKYNLKGRDPGSQERQVSRVIVHDEFSTKNLKNDIAILKLSTEVEYTPYVQPICLWPEDDTEKSKIFGKDGTVVGWGLNENDTLSEQLTVGMMPVVPDADCLLSYASFFGKFVNEKSFCAGGRNGVSACNGDSGGGLVFPVKQQDGKDTYFIRGIVSVSVSRIDKDVCDPNHYLVFTDSAKYLDFINSNK